MHIRDFNTDLLFEIPIQGKINVFIRIANAGNNFSHLFWYI